MKYNLLYLFHILTNSNSSKIILLALNYIQLLQSTLLTTSQFMVLLLGRLHDKVMMTFDGHVVFTMKLSLYAFGIKTNIMVNKNNLMSRRQ